tara:strand:+ start:129 stop:305 length:177 start_codon:yes stop_codon:yes gene_type:complete
MNPKYAPLVIVLMVIFFAVIAGILLFTNLVATPDKYIYLSLIAPLSWVAIKWLPLKKS